MLIERSVGCKLALSDKTGQLALGGETLMRAPYTLEIGIALRLRFGSEIDVRFGFGFGFGSGLGFKEIVVEA